MGTRRNAGDARHSLVGVAISEGGSSPNARAVFRRNSTARS
jgi:hypothetical protein